MILRIGTRGSQLALAQATAVAAALRGRHPGLQAEIVILQTRGDHQMDASLPSIGGKGAFTREIEQALLDGRVDVAVHSLKDLPTEPVPGLVIAAVPPRASHRDVLVSLAPLRLADLSTAMAVGTSSLRRASQLRALHPGILVQEVRGNVTTRLRKLRDGEYAALVLAEAGLERLGIPPSSIHISAIPGMLPAPGQGALGVQIRAGDARAAALVAAIHNAATAACVAAERAVLAQAGGGCGLPLGALCTLGPGGTLHLRACALSPDGATVLEAGGTAPPHEAEALGRRLGADLCARGAGELAAARPPATVYTRPRADAIRVLVTRDEDADGPLSRRLREAGITPICLPLLQLSPAEDLSPLRAAIAAGDLWDALALMSGTALDVLLAAVPDAPARLSATRLYCAGPTTAARASAAGFPRVAPPCAGGRAGAIAAIQADFAGRRARVLWLRGGNAPEAPDPGLAAEGIDISTVTVYRSTPSATAAELLPVMLRRGDLSGVVLCSSSAVHTFADLLAGSPLPPALRLFSIGPSTSATIRERFAREPVEAAEATFDSLAEMIASTAR